MTDNNPHTDTDNAAGLTRSNIDNEAIERDMTREQLKQLQRKYQNEQQRCITMAQKSVENSPMIQFLLDSMEKRGCSLPQDFVRCVPQPNLPSYGNFHPEANRIYLNSVHANNSTAIRRTVLHELIHAFDHCRVKMDYSKCSHLACTEIRAANLSGDCSWKVEWGRGNLNFKGQQKVCTKRRTKLSIQHTSACEKEDVDRVVNRVFRRCYRDTAPFPTTPKQ